MILHESGEDYLEAIYILGREHGMARSVDVAAFLGVTKPSVSRAMSILKNGEFIEMAHDGTLTLTESGVEVAKRMYDRHQFITQFFVQLGVDQNQAAEDACRIEHVISDESFDKLRDFAMKYIGETSGNAAK